MYSTVSFTANFSPEILSSLHCNILKKTLVIRDDEISFSKAESI